MCFINPHWLRPCFFLSFALAFFLSSLLAHLVSFLSCCLLLFGFGGSRLRCGCFSTFRARVLGALLSCLLACLLFSGPLPRERNWAKDKNEINSKNKKKRETKKTKKWRIILCLNICYVVSFGLRPPVCTQEREQFGAKGKFVGQDGFPLPLHVPFHPKLFFACFLADGKGIRKRHRHVTTASSFHLNWTKLPFRTKPTRSTICGHLSMYRRNVRRNSSMKLDKSFIGRKQMRISSAIKEGSGDAITSVSEKRASPSEQWRSGLMSPCRRSRSKFAEVSENLPEDTTSRKNASSVSTLQFHVEKRRLPKL